MFELDICITQDGQLVVHHDANLQRTCGVDQLISETNYKELPPFKETIEAFGSDGLTIRTVSNKIPLLEDLFKHRKTWND